MPRLSKEELARYGGANWMLEYVRKFGLDEAEAEVERRGIKGIPIGVKQSDLDKWCEEEKSNTIATVMMMAACTVQDEIGEYFKLSEQETKELVKRFIARFNDKTEVLMYGFANWKDYQDQLRDELGVDIGLPEVFTKGV
ncbi:MAG: hypothetical protein K6G81_01635 [Lachnospiraceae bacterium]|nr:hypothetical protein [Lachnospiraceae bacterium]